MLTIKEVLVEYQLAVKGQKQPSDIALMPTVPWVCYKTEHNSWPSIVTYTMMSLN